MERIGFLINKLKEQYERADSQSSMLTTLQMLYRELMPKMDGEPSVGKISVVIPGQMDLTFLEKSIGQKFALDLAPNKEGKQVFELSVEPSEMMEPVDKHIVNKVEPVQQPPAGFTKQIEKTINAAVELPKNPFVVTTPKAEIPVQKAMQPIVEKDKTAPEPEKESSFEINSRFMPQELKPTIPPVEITTVTPPQKPVSNIPTAAPPKEIHESIQTNTQPSLNDNVEKKQAELFHVLKTEPLKDLKKAISINERFQYINHLFMKDETMYERSLKTINSFNVFSEAQFWIRKELATKMGWSDDNELVQQFMHLVERRFS